MSNWRVGRKVQLNVYEDDRPMFQCHTPEEAQRVVRLLQEGEANQDKVKAFNLLLTCVNPVVRKLAERYLEGVKDMDAFIEFLRKHPIEAALADNAKLEEPVEPPH